MNLPKLLMLALLAAAVSATTMPTLSKVIGFGHSAAFAQNDNDQGEMEGDQGEDNGDGQ